MSPLARSLLEGLMDPDPEKRYTIEDVRSHPWFVLKRGGIRSSSEDDESINESRASSDSTSSTIDTILDSESSYDDRMFDAPHEKLK